MYFFADFSQRSNRKINMGFFPSFAMEPCLSLGSEIKSIFDVSLEFSLDKSTLDDFARRSNTVSTTHWKLSGIR